MLDNLDVETVEMPMNAQYLKHYFQHWNFMVHHCTYSVSFIVHLSSNEIWLHARSEGTNMQFLVFRGKKHYPQVEPDILAHLHFCLFYFQKYKKRIYLENMTKCKSFIFQKIISFLYIGQLICFWRVCEGGTECSN